MLKNSDNITIFAIAFCEICRIYTPLINERTASLDAEKKVNGHAGIKHDHNRDGMGWTNVEREMAKIRKKSGFKEGYL